VAKAHQRFNEIFLQVECHKCYRRREREGKERVKDDVYYTSIQLAEKIPLNLWWAFDPQSGLEGEQAPPITVRGTNADLRSPM
jgi:hypothetical protein